MMQIDWREISIKTAFYISVLLCLFINCSVEATFDEEFNNTIQLRTSDDWIQVWNMECFQRCRADLGILIKTACQHDIYKVREKTDTLLIEYIFDKRHRPNLRKRASSGGHRPRFPFLLQDTEAFSFLKRDHSMNKRSGIMQECCYAKGCNWEEYAEYCHSHSRNPSSGLASNCYIT